MSKREQDTWVELKGGHKMSNELMLVHGPAKSSPVSAVRLFPSFHLFPTLAMRDLLSRCTISMQLTDWHISEKTAVFTMTSDQESVSSSLTGALS